MADVRKNVDLAAALLYVEGESVPHLTEFEEPARVLVQQLKDRVLILKHVIALCGEPQTPREIFLVEKAYAWLGVQYSDEIIYWANEYLSGPPWQQLSKKVVQEKGITIHHECTARASVLLDLAMALQAKGDLEAAISHYMAAYRLEPYNALYAVKVAGAIEKKSGREEALRFLRSQRGSIYFTPVKYKDASGAVQHNDTFKQLLNAQILKWEDA